MSSWMDDLEYEGGENWEPADDFDEGRMIDGVGFANSGSALRAATRDNPRDRPCPTCGTEDVLTRIDVTKGYQCDRCADACEGGF